MVDAGFTSSVFSSVFCLFGLDPISRTAGNEASQGLHGPPAAGDFSVPAACDSAGP